MDIETVRLVLERTFQMPVAESDAQIVLDRLHELGFAESGPTPAPADLAETFPKKECSYLGCHEAAIWKTTAAYLCQKHLEKVRSRQTIVSAYPPSR